MNKRIFVGNLPWDVGFDELKKLFSPFGEIEDAIVMSDMKTRKSRGFGFITYKEEASAEKAIKEMSEKEIQGRKLTVNIAQTNEKKNRD